MLLRHEIQVLTTQKLKVTTEVVQNEASASAPVRIFCPPAIHIWCFLGCSMPLPEGSDQDTAPTHPCDVPWRPNLNPYKTKSLVISERSATLEATLDPGLQLKQLVIVFWRPSHGCMYVCMFLHDCHLLHPCVAPYLGETHWELDGLSKQKQLVFHVVIPSSFNIQLLCISAQYSPLWWSPLMIVSFFMWSRLSSFLFRNYWKGAHPNLPVLP